MNQLQDFLGSPINIGLKGIRVNTIGHYKEFKKVIIKDIDTTRENRDFVGVLTEGNTKIGWTYPERIIIETSIKDGLL